MSKTRTKALRQEFEAVNGFLPTQIKSEHYRKMWKRFKKDWRVKP